MLALASAAAAAAFVVLRRVARRADDGDSNGGDGKRGQRLVHCEGVCFDMDGLMIDSEPLWHRAETSSFAKVGLSLTLADCLETTGLRIDEVVAFHFAKFGGWNEDAATGGTSRAQVAADIVDEMETLLRTGSEPMPGLRAAIAAIRSLDVPVAVASSSPMRLIRAALTRLELLPPAGAGGGSSRAATAGESEPPPFFVVLQSAEHEQYGKPHPGVYLSALEALNKASAAQGKPPIRADRVLALEDSLNGLVAAKAAKFKCVAVPCAEDRGRGAFALADARLDSLAEIATSTQIWTDFLGFHPPPSLAAR